MNTPSSGGPFGRAVRRFRGMPWRKILPAALLVLVVIAVVPPFRRAAALGASKVILFVATPLAPGIGNFDRLQASSVVLATDGSQLADLDPNTRREPVKVKNLPDHVTRAVLAAEDKDFYHHGGVDPSGVFRALLRNARGGNQGGSTITQQLAKINYTGSERTYMRKLKEVLYAVRLEKSRTKDELLERYLNQVYFGESAYGLGAAADVFFGTTADQLTVTQAAFLAGKIRSPEGIDPRREPNQAVARRNQVLAAMERNNWLDGAEAKTAKAEPLTLAPERPADASKAAHFVEYVKREARRIDALGGTPEARANTLLTGGLTIETTLDPKAFDASTAIVQEKLGVEGDPTAAVVSVAPGDGAIRNLFGGLSFARQFDVASQGRRQPGSSFKPFVYLAMLREGIDPRTTFDAASPQTFEYNGETFEVNNYEGEGGGPTDADTAMVHSVNTVYMRIGIEAGPDNVVKVAKDLAAPAPDSAISDVAAVSLGGLRQGVTPLEMAAAYATFAARGLYAEPYAIARIKDGKGNLLYEHKPETRRVFKADEVGVLNNATQRVITEGTGRAAAIGRPVAGKTGTTENYGDAWFVGYAKQLATAVWVGNADEVVPMLNVHGIRVTGGSFPAQIFAATMKAALDGVPSEPLYTASPDKLNLRKLKIVPDSTTSTSSSTTSSTSTTTPKDSTTTTAPATTTTQKGKPTTTTTSPPPTTTTTPATTSTTVRSAGASTTTAPPG